MLSWHPDACRLIQMQATARVTTNSLRYAWKCTDSSQLQHFALLHAARTCHIVRRLERFKLFSFTDSVVIGWQSGGAAEFRRELCCGVLWQISNRKTRCGLAKKLTYSWNTLQLLQGLKQYYFKSLFACCCPFYWTMRRQGCYRKPEGLQSFPRDKLAVEPLRCLCKPPEHVGVGLSTLRYFL